MYIIIYYNELLINSKMFLYIIALVENDKSLRPKQHSLALDPIITEPELQLFTPIIYYP